MLFADSWVLIVVCYSLLVVGCWLFAVCCLLFVGCWPLVVFLCRCVVCFLVFVVFGVSLFVVCCLLFVVMMFDVCCF